MAYSGRGGGIRFTIGIMVDTPEEVDQVAEHMRTAAARATKEPVDAGVLHRPLGRPLRPRRQLLRDHLGRADQPDHLAPRHQNLTTTRLRTPPSPPGDAGLTPPCGYESGPCRQPVRSSTVTSATTQRAQPQPHDGRCSATSARRIRVLDHGRGEARPGWAPRRPESRGPPAQPARR